ncbi:MAG: acyl-CoA dehydrogenase family protein [Desulfobacterales bacterium]|nr:acyl-CoA dehydrogenase family protein [Desulfobacterales bacterium]MDD4070900.1 acyl-CoA dehydrogenase family protein [Desulfobacterales bacterium]MDD4392907.1 acyl-CoA dehydrogenase family protein [Desulfobacterales bacterium]
MGEPTPVLKGPDDESRQMIVDMVRQLKKKLLTRDKILEYDKGEIFPEETIRQLLGPEIGLQLLFIPEIYGGMGGGARDCVAVTREMARICLGIGTAFFAVQLGADPIIVGATDEQKQKWLGKIAEGNFLVAYAVTEADAGSNLAALKTKAEPEFDGAGEVIGYRINGTKQFISTGGYADFITLLANTPQGPSFFIVEKGTQGFVQGKGEEKHGIRASNTSALSFSDVFVPAVNLIGMEPGQGLKQANQVFGYTRLMVAAMALGAGESALDIAIRYAAQRVQFGTTLSEKQGYVHKLIVPNVVMIEAAKAYIDEVAIRLDSGENDLQVEGSIAKLFVTEAANKTADDCMQALGGYGYISEFEVEKIKRDVKITCIYEGTSEIQQNIISTFRWKKTRKSKGGFYKAISAEMSQLHDITPDAGCRYCGLAATVLNETIMLAHEHRLVRQQGVMFLLADMMTAVEVGASLARKAVSLTRIGSDDAAMIRAASRVFANRVVHTVCDNMKKILMGTGAPDFNVAADVIKSPACEAMMESYRNVICDMDLVADQVFKR